MLGKADQPSDSWDAFTKCPGFSRGGVRHSSHPAGRTSHATTFFCESDMIRLLYFSLAAPTMTSEDHCEILASARRNNEEKDLTGVLVTGGGVFLQVLEGPQQSVLSLYLKILEDKRHSDVEIMRVTPIIDRIFGDWLMASVEATPLEFEQIMKFKLDHFAFDEPKEFMATMYGIKTLLKSQMNAAGVSSHAR